MFSSRHVAPAGAAPLEITTSAQQARGERVFASATGRTERPAALVFYAIGGYLSLLAALAWGILTLIRSPSA
jgi:hypothetical protein